MFGNQTCGILEWSAISIHPDQEDTHISSLVNPEYPIDKEITALTGLSSHDAHQAEKWPDVGANYMYHVANHHLVVGYASLTFDCPVVVTQARRYSLPIPRFREQLDVMRLYQQLSGKRSTLDTAAAHFGIEANKPLHRAANDTMLTAQLLEALLSWFGLEHVLTPPISRAAGKSMPRHRDYSADLPTLFRIADHIEHQGFHGIKALADSLNLTDYDTSRYLVAALAQAIVTPTQIGHPEIQSWLDKEIPYVLTSKWLSGNRNLKPLMNRLSLRNAPSRLDYPQLKAALIRQNL